MFMQMHAFIFIIYLYFGFSFPPKEQYFFKYPIYCTYNRKK